jgi:hypothetical protein
MNKIQNIKELCMKFLSKDSNFNQVIMLNEFELLERPLMVEMIRLKQTPRKSSNPDQMSDLIISKIKFQIFMQTVKLKFQLIIRQMFRRGHG